MGLPPPLFGSWKAGAPPPAGFDEEKRSVSGKVDDDGFSEAPPKSKGLPAGGPGGGEPGSWNPPSPPEPGSLKLGGSLLPWGVGKENIGSEPERESEELGSEPVAPNDEPSPSACVGVEPGTEKEEEKSMELGGSLRSTGLGVSGCEKPKGALPIPKDPGEGDGGSGAGGGDPGSSAGI